MIADIVAKKNIYRDLFVYHVMKRECGFGTEVEHMCRLIYRYKLSNELYHLVLLRPTLVKTILNQEKCNKNFAE